MATELATAYVSLVASSGSLARSVQQEFARVNVRRAGQQAGEQYTQGMGASIRSTAGSVFTPLKVASGLLLAGTAAAAKWMASLIGSSPPGPWRASRLNALLTVRP